MRIRLKDACIEDAPRLLEMQVRTFLPLAEKYNDVENSPAYETAERMLERITGKHSACHIILSDEFYVGMIHVKTPAPGEYKISLLFVLPEYQNLKIAQKALNLLDLLYPDAAVWTLLTIGQEARNCHFYEKLGFVKTGAERRINDKMTLIGYERRV